MKLTGVNVREEDEGLLVKGQQGIQHQSIDLNGVLDVCGDRVLQSHNIVLLLHLVTCNMNERTAHHIQTYTSTSPTLFLIYLPACLHTQPGLDDVLVVLSVVS